MDNAIHQHGATNPVMRRAGLGRTSLRVLAIALLLGTPSQAQSGLLTPVSKWNEERAAHLLRRAGFGGTPEQIQHFVRIGPSAAVGELVDYDRIPQTHADYLPFDIPDEKKLRQAFERLGRADAEQHDRLAQRLVQSVRQFEVVQISDFRAWWLERMIRTPRPLEEKLTLFWHGLFTSGFREVHDSLWLIRQNQFLRDHAAGSFQDLLVGISKDPAMLRYLNNIANVQDHPNENYARELLELFTMGRGHYSEKDVREAARAFTGWTVRDGRFFFAEKKHDAGEKIFLGEKGPWNGEDIIDILLRRNATSRHLAEKLLNFFVQEHPPESLLSELELEIRRKRFDVKEVLRTLFLSEAFYRPDVEFALVKSPVELVAGTCRLLEIEPANSHALALATDSMGQTLFQPPNVKGWDGGLAWINTATLFSRYSFAARLLEGNPNGEVVVDGGGKQLEDSLALLRESLPPGFPELRAPKRCVESRAQPPYDPMSIAGSLSRGAPEQVVQHWSDRLLQQTLPEHSRSELQRILSESKGNKEREEDECFRMVGLIKAILCLPEYQVN